MPQGLLGQSVQMPLVQELAGSLDLRTHDFALIVRRPLAVRDLTDPQHLGAMHGGPPVETMPAYYTWMGLAQDQAIIADPLHVEVPAYLLARVRVSLDQRLAGREANRRCGCKDCPCPLQKHGYDAIVQCLCGVEVGLVNNQALAGFPSCRLNMYILLSCSCENLKKRQRYGRSSFLQRS
jgi:hypothetical protein